VEKNFLVLFPSSGRYMRDYSRNLFVFIKVIYVANVFFTNTSFIVFIGTTILEIKDNDYWTFI
jgi:hypothetical protein